MGQRVHGVVDRIGVRIVAARRDTSPCSRSPAARSCGFRRSGSVRSSRPCRSGRCAGRRSRPAIAPRGAARRCRRRRPAAGSCRIASAPPADRPSPGGCCGRHPTVNVGTEAGMPSCFATAVAVGGISCISPRAPEELTAPMSKLLSWRMIPSETPDRAAAAGSNGAGQPACGSTSPSRPMRRATNTAASGIPAYCAKAAVSAAFGRDRRQFVHPQSGTPGRAAGRPRRSARRRRAAPRAGERQRGVLGPGRDHAAWR